jgi:hypothetical protein
MPEPSSPDLSSPNSASLPITASLGFIASACSIRHWTLSPAVSAAIGIASAPWILRTWAMTSSVLTPMEPVEPSTVTVRPRTSSMGGRASNILVAAIALTHGLRTAD